MRPAPEGAGQASSTRTTRKGLRTQLRGAVA